MKTLEEEASTAKRRGQEVVRQLSDPSEHGRAYDPERKLARRMRAQNVWTRKPYHRGPARVLTRRRGHGRRSEREIRKGDVVVVRYEAAGGPGMREMLGLTAGSCGARTWRDVALLDRWAGSAVRRAD